MLKLSGESHTLDNSYHKDELIVDTSGEFWIHVSEDKSNSNLENNDSLLIETSSGGGFWKKGTLEIEKI